MSLRVVILYTELADYCITCFKALRVENADLFLVHWPVNPEAPFQFDLSFCEAHYSRNQISDHQLLEKVGEFNPSLILCSGWTDKGYLAICHAYHSKISTVLSMDNHWAGNLKQRIWSLLSPWKLHRTFSHAFVPGRPQSDYAFKLGFASDVIQTGFYSADVQRFDRFYQDQRAAKKEQFPKRFLYMGRYVTHKGIFDLWEAFKQFRDEFPDWEMWCAGMGDQYKNRVEYKGIRHFGFVQPNDMTDLLAQSGVYILPSHFEPWGVSVHEMAVAGFPMLLSDKVGSREAFLKNGENGFVFEHQNIASLLNAMRRIANSSNEQFAEMSEISHELGMKITPEKWAEKLLKFIQK